MEDLLYLRIMAGMLAGKEFAEIAREEGCTDRAIRNWRGTPRWAELWAEVASAQLGHVRAQLIGLTSTAVSTIREVLADASYKGAPTRLSAALAVIDRASHIIPDGGDKEIRRIITRIPRSMHTPEIPQEEPAEPMPQPEAPAALDSPTNWGIAGDMSHPRAIRTGKFRQVGTAVDSVE